MSSNKPTLSFWQIWNMSFGFLGIQFGFALQNANVSRIFETLGAKVDEIPILWVAAPLTGLIVQPIIGYMSDRTWGKWGRRRPFFLVGALLASAAIVFMPLSPVLWVAAGMLWIMDASINISMEPFRAFVGDMLPESQRNKGFAMQTFFIGVGAVIASALPYMLSSLGVTDTAGEGMIPDTVKWSFFIGGAVFLLCVLYTVFTTKEYSPEELASFEAAENPGAAQEEEAPVDRAAFQRKGLIWLGIGVAATAVFWYLINQGIGKQELYVLGGMLALYGIAQLLVGFQSGGKRGGLTNIMVDLNNMPKTMSKLAVVQFFSWFALFSMWIYTSNTVSRHYYDTHVGEATLVQMESALTGENFDADQKAELTEELAVMRAEFQAEGSAFTAPAVYKPMLEGALVDELTWAGEISASIQDAGVKQEAADIQAGEAAHFSAEAWTLLAKEGLVNTPELQAQAELRQVQSNYNAGGDWVGVCFSVYNGVAAIFAFVLVWLAGRINRRRTHMVSLVAGGLGLALLFFGSDPNVLLVAMIGVGMAWASILSMPYAMLTSTLPVSKLGVYMGIFNFFIVIPQLVAASLLGVLVGGLFGGDPVYAMLVGGASMIIGGVLCLRIGEEAES